MSEIGRRKFLGLAGAGALGLVAAACSSSAPKSSAPPATTPASTLPAPDKAPFDTVVVMMMENRSFDHMLGWLPGADGKQAGLSYADPAGKFQTTHALAPDFTGCANHDPKHDWVSVAGQFNDGKMDGFLSTQVPNDTFAIGYYGEHDLPITAALAKGHTVCDRYHCSMLGPTGPNRMYAWSATTDYLEHDGILDGVSVRPSKVQLAIWDRLRAAGVRHGYYAGVEPQSYAFASKKYDSITQSHAAFFAAAKQGTLPSVTYLDPDLDSIAEAVGNNTDDHPYGDLRQGEAWIAKVYNALAASPQWDRMVFVLTFDEHGGFYDHVAPPAVADDTVLPAGIGTPDLTRLGIRVPTIVMGAFAPARVDHGGPYEHCSILKMIEWRWGLEPMTARDRGATNLATALDFTSRQRPITLPALHVGAAPKCTPEQIKEHLTT